MSAATMDGGNNTEPRWIIDIKKPLDGDGGLTYNSGRSWTIYRIPSNLSEVHKSEFLPKAISIGPFHRRGREERPELQVMEEHKMRFLARLLGGKKERSRSNGDSSTTATGDRESDDSDHEEDDDGGRRASTVLLDDLVEAMKKLETKTRARYSESFDDRINSNDFVQMMVLDGCFLVELLRLYYYHVHTGSLGGANEDDRIFATPWMLRTLQRDLLMLENQLPFFVLQKIFKLINTTNNNIDKQSVSLEVLAVTFFDPLLPRQNAASKLNPKIPHVHLLQVFRSTFLRSVRPKNEKKELTRVISQLNGVGTIGTRVRERQLIHFVSELQDAGVRFEKREGCDLLDINFDGRTLKVPQLSIDDSSVPLFLNFVAYEQCDYNAKPFFTTYFMFWDSLVNSPEDIQILHEHRIVNHVLGNNEAVAHLVNKLCREIVYDLDRCYLYDEIKKLNDYCRPYDRDKYRVWYRKLVRQHFSNPWTCISFFAAIFLLLLTVLQTLYTVYPYYRPN